MFRVYFDIGFLAWERLGFAQKLGHAQKLRRKRLNYSLSVDEEHFKETNTKSLQIKKILNRRESVGNFFNNNKDQASEFALKAKLDAQTRRRKSCIEASLEIYDDDNTKSPTNDDQIIKLNSFKELNKLNDKYKRKDKNIDKNSEKDGLGEKLIDRLSEKEDKNCELLESEFSSLSMLANLSELNRLESSNSSLSTSTEENRFLNQQDDKLAISLKRKKKRINHFKHQQSIDSDTNCILM